MGCSSDPRGYISERLRRSSSGIGAGFNLDPGGQSDLVGWTEAILVFTSVPKPFNTLCPAPGVFIPRSQNSTLVCYHRCPVGGTVELPFSAPRAPGTRVLLPPAHPPQEL